MLSTEIIPNDIVMSRNTIWSEYNPEPEEYLKKVTGTYLSMQNTKRHHPFYTACTSEFCDGDEADGGEYFDDNVSVDDGFVAELDPAIEDTPIDLDTPLDDWCAIKHTEPAIEEALTIENVLDLKAKPVSKPLKKAQNQKVTRQKGKSGKKIKYTEPPIEELTPADALPKRVSKTVFYAVPCGAFKLRSGKTHGKALKPSRILLDQVREQERARKRNNRQASRQQALVQPMKEPEQLEPTFQPPQEPFGSTCLEMSRAPSTQDSEMSHSREDLDDLRYNPHFELGTDCSKLSFKKDKQTPVIEHMMEEHIPQDRSFDVCEFLITNPSITPLDSSGQEPNFSSLLD
jgi:hypothetical protein